MLTKLTKKLRLKMSVATMSIPQVVATPGGPDHFVRCTPREYKLGEPDPAHDDACLVEAGRHVQADRNFLFYPWIQGKISYVHVTHGQPYPVVTGPMSGCWLVIFTMGGQTCFGHIGTFMGKWTAESIQATNSWKVAVGTGKVTIVKAFKPIEPTSMDTFGAMAGNQDFHTLGFNKVQVGPNFYHEVNATALTAGVMKLDL
jgi:hypothetical protein